MDMGEFKGQNKISKHDKRKLDEKICAILRDYYKVEIKKMHQGHAKVYKNFVEANFDE